MKWILLIVALSAWKRPLAIEQAKRKALTGHLFTKQREAISDPAPLRCWQCDRRSGKTTGAMVEFFIDGRKHRNYEYAYIALTRSSAKRIAWPILKELKYRHKLQARLRESELRVELPTDSAITLFGADRPDWIDRLYGQKFAKIWIDEAAFYSIDLRQLIDDVLEPTVADLRGSITLMSRPGHVPRGLYWELCEKNKQGWSVKKWSWRDNPHMVNQVNELLERRTKDDSDYLNRPSTRRNWFNEWVHELGKRVYLFDIDKNGLPADWSPPKDAQYILGIDRGWFDYTAFVIGTWSESSDKYVELECYRERELTLDKMAARIRMYRSAYPGIRMVCDSAQRDAFEELKKRYHLPIMPAHKSDKRYWIDQYNTDLGQGLICIRGAESSLHVEEMLDLTWDEKRSGAMVESPRSTNDLCDAALYAFRAARHFSFEEPEREIKKGTKEWYQQQAEEMEKQAEEKYG